MPAEKVLYDALKADSAVDAFVAGRIYPNLLPAEATLPAIVYQRVSTTPEYYLTGSANLDHTRIQVSSWAKTYRTAKQLATAVRLALEGAGFLVVMDLDDIDEETREHRVITDFTAWAAP